MTDNFDYLIFVCFWCVFLCVQSSSLIGAFIHTRCNIKQYRRCRCWCLRETVIKFCGKSSKIVGHWTRSLERWHLLASVITEALDSTYAAGDHLKPKTTSDRFTVGDVVDNTYRYLVPIFVWKALEVTSPNWESVRARILLHLQLFSSV